MCTVLLPPGDNPIAVNKYIISYHIISKRRHISKSSVRYVLSVVTTLESYAHCSRYLARLSARNKPTLLTPDSRPLLGDNVPFVSVSV